MPKSQSEINPAGVLEIADLIFSIFYEINIETFAMNIVNFASLVKWWEDNKKMGICASVLFLRCEWAAGLALDQVGRQDHAGHLQLLTIDQAQEHSCCGASQFQARSVYGCQGRIHDFGVGEVIETDHDHMFRHAQAPFVERAVDPGGLAVVAGKDCRGRFRQVQQSHSCDIPISLSEIPIALQLGIDRQICRVQGRAVAGNAFDRISGRRGFADISDASMPKLNQMHCSDKAPLPTGIRTEGAVASRPPWLWMSTKGRPERSRCSMAMSDGRTT